MDEAIEVKRSVERDHERRNLSNGPDRNATIAEQMLAAVIAGYPGPIIEADDLYNGAGDEDAQAVARAHVYMRITARSYHDLELHLRSSPTVRDRLGLDGVLDHTSFARSWRGEQFGDVTTAYLEAYTEWVRDELDELDIAEVEPFLQPEPAEVESPPEIPQGPIDEGVDHIRDILLGTTDFDRGPNTTHADTDLIDIALDACRERSELNPIITDNGHDPALKTLLNAINNRDAEECQEEFEQINDRVLDAAKGAGMLGRPVDGDLDITVIPFYPQNLSPPDGARKGEKKAGTVHGFHFGTLVAHDKDHNKDVVVAQAAYTPEMKPLDLVKELVEQAEEHCNLDTLTLDSAFSGTDVISYLNEKGIDFITRLKGHGADLKGILAQMTGLHDDFENFIKESSDSSIFESVRVVSQPDWKHATKEALNRSVDTQQSSLENFDKMGDARIPDPNDLPALLWKSRRPYATNIDDRTAEEVIRRYKYRWRVENSYADKKSKLLAKTQSREHGIRVFLFWLTALLYNGWMLIRAFIRLDFPNHAPQDRPPITARQYMKSILGIDYR